MPELASLGVRRALLLQGPAGPFMRRFAEELADAGVAVWKVNLHAGDRLFFPSDTPFAQVREFRGPRAEWSGFVSELIADEGIDGLFLFGDCRPLHRVAIAEAEARGAKVFAFEEGYLRPDWITLERHGVNGHSRMPRDPQAFLDAALPDPEEPLSVGRSFGLSAWYSALNALAFTHKNGDFAFYEHHRSLNAWRYAGWYARNIVRKNWFAWTERDVLAELTGRWSGRFYFVPLQVFCDFQLTHSPYDDVVEFIHDVTERFARHAPADVALVFKHHPMDRPFREYGALMAELRARHGLGERLIYVHDLHLPTLLRHARATLTINSTVGLSSIHHGTPVCCFGTAVYDLPGLTFQGEAADFLRDPGPAPDEALYRAFRRYLIAHNQVNGNFYKRVRDGSPTGFNW